MIGRLKMTTTATRKKAGLRLVLALAVAIGCSSATLSGVLATFAIQTPPAHSTLA